MFTDIPDDVSYFYVGTEEEGFHASESVCDSDISETDSEADDDDDGDWSLDNECKNQSVYERIGNGLMISDLDLNALDDLDDSSFCIGNEERVRSAQSAFGWGFSEKCSKNAAVATSDDDDDGWFLDSECENNDANESSMIGLTMACSELNWLLDSNSNIKCVKKSSVESIRTTLTMASSEPDSIDGASFDAEIEEEFYTSENDYDENLGEVASVSSADACHDLPSVIECAHQDVDGSLMNDCLHLSEIMAEALSMMEDEDVFHKMLSVNEHQHRSVDTVIEEMLMEKLLWTLNSEPDAVEDASLHNRKEERLWSSSRIHDHGDTLKRILHHPLFISALLTNLAQGRKKRETKLSETFPSGHTTHGMEAIPDL